MATLHVKNTSSIGKAFKVRGGFHVVAAGASEDVPNARPLTDEQIAALALEGLNIKLVDESDKTAAGPGRDENGDTPEMADMRKQFDASYGVLAKRLKAVADAFGDVQANEANVDQRVTTLIADLKAKEAEIAALKAPAAKTAAEVLAMAAAEGVHFKTFQAEAKKLLGDKTPSGKDEIVKALGELAKD